MIKQHEVSIFSQILTADKANKKDVIWTKSCTLKYNLNQHNNTNYSKY